MITLTTLAQASAQEVFDQVRAGLLAQGKQSKNHDGPGGRCLYRGPNGFKCAAGFLMDDSEYNCSRMESIGWSGLVRRALVPDNHADLIIQLQTIHDKTEPKSWDSALRRLAEQHGLKYEDES